MENLPQQGLDINFDKIFEQIIMPWFYNKPIFFKLFCLYKLKPNPEIPIPFRTGVNVIEYNPYILAEGSKKQLRNQLLLELERILLRHPFRRPKDTANFDKALWYEASTLTITQKGIECYGFAHKQSIEYYYEELCKKKEKVNADDDAGNVVFTENAFDSNDASSFFELSCEDEQPQTGVGDSGTTAGESEQSQTEEGDSDAETDDQEKNEKASELWSCDDEEEEQRISEFIRDNNRNWGNTPLYLKQMISVTKKAKIPSFINLLEYFKGVRGRGDRISTRMRPSRRFGYAQMGSKTRPVPGRILVGLDVSGSISNEIIGVFYSAIVNIFDKSIKYIDVFQFDTELKTKKPVPFKKRSLYNIVGGGGTSFQPIFDYAIEHQNLYDGLIIFTDGYAPEPDVHHKLRTKVLWVLDTEENYMSKADMLKKTGMVTALMEKHIFNYVPVSPFTFQGDNANG